MSHFHRAIWRSYKPAKPHHPDESLPDFTIKLHEGGSIIEGLTVEAGYGGPRDLAVLKADQRKGQMGNLISPGHVDFITARGKRWSIKLSEFSFLFGYKKPKPEAKPAPVTPMPPTPPEAA